MKENYQIYLPYQFHWRPHAVGGDPQLPHKKMKTLFLSNMSKSRRLTSTFFPIIKYLRSAVIKGCLIEWKHLHLSNFNLRLDLIKTSFFKVLTYLNRSGGKFYIVLKKNQLNRSIFIDFMAILSFAQKLICITFVYWR